MKINHMGETLFLVAETMQDAIELVMMGQSKELSSYVLLDPQRGATLRLIVGMAKIKNESKVDA